MYVCLFQFGNIYKSRSLLVNYRLSALTGVYKHECMNTYNLGETLHNPNTSTVQPFGTVSCNLYVSEEMF